MFAATALTRSKRKPPGLGRMQAQKRAPDGKRPCHLILPENRDLSRRAPKIALHANPRFSQSMLRNAARTIQRARVRSQMAGSLGGRADLQDRKRRSAPEI